jgi:uncharacterized protein
MVYCFDMGADRLIHPPQLHVDLPESEIARFCVRWHVATLALFGSVLREDFKPESDINVLLELEAGHRIGILELMQMETELKDAFGRNVMVITRAGLDKSLNEERRRRILDSAEVIYARR